MSSPKKSSSNNTCSRPGCKVRVKEGWGYCSDICRSYDGGNPVIVDNRTLEEKEEGRREWEELQKRRERKNI